MAQTENYVSGLFGTGDFGADVDPGAFDNVTHEFGITGTAPFLALLKGLPSQPIGNTSLKWWERRRAEQNATITNIFTDAGLSNAYTSGGVAGATLYVKMSAVDVAQFRPGLIIMLNDASETTVDVKARAINRTVNGASSFLEVKLLEADDNGTNDLSDADIAIIISSAQPEGSESPNSLTRNPFQFENITQIAWDSFKLSGTARATDTRTGSVYNERKGESFQRFLAQREKNIWFGVQSSSISEENGEEIRTMDGIATVIAANTSNNFNYVTDSDFSGQSWLAGGIGFLEDKLEILAREAQTDPMFFAGSAAIKAVNQLARTHGEVNLRPTSTQMGMKVNMWTTSQGDFPIVTHPLFSEQAIWRDMMICVQPSKLKVRPLAGRDTTFLPDENFEKGGSNANDFIVEGWRVEETLQYLNLESMGIFRGLGSTNTA